MKKKAKAGPKKAPFTFKNGRAPRQAFVYVVCGDRHADRLNISLRFLKKFSKKEIIVLASRTSAPIHHDQVVRVPSDKALSDHQMAITMKTGIHRLLPDPRLKGCYLDNDVIAVNRGVDSIFTRAKGPFAFAKDHINLSTFSRHAVACGCQQLQCGHLVEAIGKKFKVQVGDPEWFQWNGGVFVFSKDAAPLLDCWDRYTRDIFNDPYWKTRDQGTLVAALWRLGLQGKRTLPCEYNFIVDCFQGVNLRDRDKVQPQTLAFNDSYSLLRNGTKPKPSLLHFINDGVMRRGWKNWDDVEKRLGGEKLPTPAPPKAPRAPKLSASNRVVHGMWIGSRLSKLEQLTIHSFLEQGHEFHLWLYGDLETPLPRQVILEDANEIIHHSRIIRKKDNDPETGVGKGSVGAPFSDLFRYKLLYEKGGYWVDMDVTCLKPLNFPGEYLFRTHRVGVVGNVMKCPPKSRLMKMTYERVERLINEDTPWLLPNRILSENVKRLKLSRFIRPGITNEDKWGGVILPLIEGDPPLPKEWFAIHWVNEMWRTLKNDGGMYKGKQFMNLTEIPDKENPPPSSTLGRFYARYGLDSKPSTEGAGEEAISPVEMPEMPLPSVASAGVRQPVSPHISHPFHLNVMLPSLAIGGAERTVIETMQGLAKHPASAKLFLQYDSRPSYDYNGFDQKRVYRLHPFDMETKMRIAAFEVLASPTPVLFTHMVHVNHLRLLWRWGVSTVPVVHNSRPSWQNDPSGFDNPHVPFVVAVSEDVAAQLRAAGCPKPIVTVRHELQQWFSPGELEEQRRRIREIHSVPDDTLLIGMVGEFKTQKAYTRAVRVLAEVRRHRKAKLLILGGWDHKWGNGRLTYEATCQQALELGVMPDLLTPGPVKDIAPYYAAFDVFLNTSVYEGLSIATLEAVHAGCPIVSADAGGNRECLPPEAVIVKDSADIASYVAGIAQVLPRGQRLVPVPPPDADLIPRLWCYLGQFGLPHPDPRDKTGVLFLCDNLNLGGAPRSLVNLLCGLPRDGRTWLGVLHQSNHQAFLDELESAGVPVFTLRKSRAYLDRVEQILVMIRRLGVGTVVFWNVDAKVKLTLAKILPPGEVRLVDVSPGPWTYEDMDNAAGLQQRLALDAKAYFHRLDHFVSKYKGGEPPGIKLSPRKLSIIPNGVPDFLAALPPGDGAKLVSEATRELIIGTCCRILPAKRIEFLVEMLAELSQRLPGVKMILVGAAHPRYEEYWRFINQRARDLGVDNLHFAGHQADVVPYLRQFQAFVLLGTDHGCPNASLEAMSVGLPIVAAQYGGTAEQVEPGVNGFLVSGSDPKEMAHSVRMLLMNPKMRERFGQASRRIVNEKFMMDLMVKRYQAILGYEKNGVGKRKTL